jgi:hypothetical protein
VLYKKKKGIVMEISIYHHSSFKAGQYDTRDDARAESESGKIITVHDGDVTTYVYEMPEWLDIQNERNKEDLANGIKNAFGSRCGSFLATFVVDPASGDIAIDFNGSVTDTVDGLKQLDGVDSDGYSELTHVYEYVADDAGSALCSSGYMSSDAAIAAAEENGEEQWVIDGWRAGVDEVSELVNYAIKEKR